MEDQLTLPRLRLAVVPDALPLFTTVLQSGIEIKTAQGISLAKFLSNFPDFTAEYLSDTVQTIFLNGTAVDDLSQPLTGNNSVVALSAAMPGLAGAIFRRNSFHSALRTATKSLQSNETKQKIISVHLKLFNSIAKERGAALLKSGVCIKADLLAGFLAKRPHLRQQIMTIQFEKEQIGDDRLIALLAELAKVNLYIVGADD